MSDHVGKVADGLSASAGWFGYSSDQEPPVGSDQVGRIVEAGHVGAAGITGEFCLNGPEFLSDIHDQIDLAPVSSTHHCCPCEVASSSKSLWVVRAVASSPDDGYGQRQWCCAGEERALGLPVPHR